MEVIFSLGIMSIALVALVSVLTTGLRAESQSTSKVNAQDFALQVMGRTLSEIEDLPLTEAQAFWSSDQAGTPWRNGVGTLNRTTFKYEIRCYQMGGSSGTALLAGDRNQLKKIAVTIYWRDTTSKSKDSSLTVARLLNREI
jgi:type II secretory pathway pseudopilin PulG